MKKIIATHYPNVENFVLDRNPVYVQEPYSRYNQYGKPVGLWVSFDEDERSWPTWCESENFCTLGVGVDLDISMLNLLVINNREDMLQFTDRYCDIHGVVVWPSVVNDYDGIIIPRYQWSCRLDKTTRWYYEWDCASGCIWNVEKIEVVEQSQ